MERLLLLTGSGNDTIVQNVTGTDDEFRLGGGNDSLTLTGLGAGASSAGSDKIDMGTGNDTLLVSGGSVSDTIALGDGDDKFTLSGAIGVSTLDGGTGAETLNFDGAAASAAKYMTFGLQKADASWVSSGIHHRLQHRPERHPAHDRRAADCAGRRAAAVAVRLQQQQHLHRVADLEGRGDRQRQGRHPRGLARLHQRHRVRRQRRRDTFYADWSSWTEAVTWTNAKNAGNSQLSDEAVTTIGATHQVKVSGMERLLLLTGSGNDTIVQNVTGTDDEFRPAAATTA
ncbi:MAG: hypothetical protein IPG91_01495 [Ideonella sp.]|nr:hypothetical protein [Ideonella sp.]